MQLHVSPTEPARLALDGKGRIVAIDENGAAARAGLRFGDTLVKVGSNDKSWHVVGGADSISELLSSSTPRSLCITILRSANLVVERGPKSPRAMLFDTTPSSPRSPHSSTSRSVGSDSTSPTCIRYSPASHRISATRNLKRPLTSADKAASPRQGFAICI